MLVIQKKYDRALSVTGKHFMKQILPDDDDDIVSYIALYSIDGCLSEVLKL